MFPLLYEYLHLYLYWVQSDPVEQCNYSATQNNQHIPAGDLLVPEQTSQVQEGLGRVEEGC